MDDDQRYSIEAACQRLIVRLTHLVDNHCPVEAADLFVTDGVWVRGGRTYRGREEIIASFQGSERARIRHVVSNTILDVSSPSTATSISYYILFRHDGQDEQVRQPMPMQLPFSMGEWHDRFVFDGDRWRFAAREVRRLFQRAEPQASASQVITVQAAEGMRT